MSLQRFSLLLETWPTGPQQEAVENNGDTVMRCRREAGIPVVVVEREAPGLGEAITMAIRDVETIGLRAVGVAQDDEARPVVATAACLALDLRALPISGADRSAIIHLVNA